ncbi:hypothetical protein GCM10010415_10390 [Streptomyces atrovirens]
MRSPARTSEAPAATGTGPVVHITAALSLFRAEAGPAPPGAIAEYGHRSRARQTAWHCSTGKRVSLPMF